MANLLSIVVCLLSNILITNLQNTYEAFSKEDLSMIFPNMDYVALGTKIKSILLFKIYSF